MILWVIIAAALLTIACTAVLFWRMGAEVTTDARNVAQAIAAEFQKTLNFTPEVRVDSVLVVQASTPLMELVTLQKQAVVRHRYTHTWMQSTKVFEVEALFTAKAGFDLKEPFRVQIDPRTQNIGAEFPPPKILSIGMSDVKVLNDEDGIWNKLTAEDRQKAFAELEEKAREEFESSSLLVETRYETERRIRALLKQSAWDASFVPAGQSPKAAN